MSANVRVVFFFVDALGGPGVKKKYAPLINSLSKSSLIDVDVISSGFNGSKLILLFLYLFYIVSLCVKNLFSPRASTTYLFVRSNLYLNFLLVTIYSLGLRRFMPLLIFEIPTPFFSLARELRRPSLLLPALLKASFKLASLSNILVLYSKDESYPLNYNSYPKRSDLYLGNWATFEPHAICSKDRELIAIERPDSCLNLILIANLSPWHGADLLLDSLENNSLKYRINLSILSPPSETFIELKTRYSDQPAFRSQINFYENPSRAAVSSLLSQSDIGIGMLAGFRICLSSASPIKHKDYMHHGLPVIYSGEDIDINSSQFSDFCLGNCYSDNDVKNNLRLMLNDIFSGTIKIPSKNSVRNYAESNLSASSKANILAKCIMSYQEKV